MLAFAKLGNDADFGELFFRKLALDVKAADGFHFVAKEIDTIGQFVRKRKNVQDTSACGVLPRLVNVIHTGKAIRVQHLRYKTGIHLFAHRQP
ncbi:hypothetical protein SDC9_146821 [bioreactor metagenome]|uniref:Uncharacterized protein n=1 Tax=bioreactor metagenome TaxID=1076179 RepID=A0A645EE67_9ZZZZ